MGGFAEYACAPEKSLELKPTNVSFEEASTESMAALTALQDLRDEGQIQSGYKVLIHGASGGVGTFAIQIAKSFETEVTAVCSSRNADIARSIGADHVMDYTHEDFPLNEELYDLILVANGNRSIDEYKQALKPNGICALAGGGGGSILELIVSMCQEWWISKTENKKIGSFLANINQKDLAFMKELLASGKVKPVIDQRSPISWRRTCSGKNRYDYGTCQQNLTPLVPDSATLRGRLSEDAFKKTEFCVFTVRQMKPS